MPDDVPEFIDPVEDCPWRPPREIFARYGYVPLAPREINEQQLPGRLWEFLYAAAGRRIFFSHTNHLSDRELYQLLYEEWLEEPIADIPLEALTITNVIVAEIDFAGMSHEEIYLRYYASEEEREEWRSMPLGFTFPPHEDPPCDRDRHLPMAADPTEA